MARTEKPRVDLSKAEPIETTIAALERYDPTSDPKRYALVFLAALDASDISILVEMSPEGECLRAGIKMDEQERPRVARHDALFEHLSGTPARRAAVIAYLNSAGRFDDNRTYDTAEEAVAAMLAIGGCIMLDPKGELEEKFRLPPGKHVVEVDVCEGWPRKRTLHRYRNTISDNAVAERVRQIVRAEGVRHPGSGWIVLDAADWRIAV